MLSFERFPQDERQRLLAILDSPPAPVIPHGQRVLSTAVSFAEWRCGVCHRPVSNDGSFCGVLLPFVGAIVAHIECGRPKYDYATGGGL